MTCHLLSLYFRELVLLSNNPRPGFESYRLNQAGTHPWDGLRSSLSIGSFWASLEAVQLSGKHPTKQVYTPKGSRSSPWPLLQKATLDQWFDSFFVPDSEPATMEEHFEGLQKLVALCRENSIDLQFVLTPGHILKRRILEKSSQVTAYENWKRRIIALGPKTWDFNDVNSVTTGPVSVDRPYFEDMGHFYQDVGDLMIVRVLGVNSPDIPEDFGQVVSPETLETHLKGERSRYKMWKQNNPTDIKQLEKYYKRKASNPAEPDS